MNYLTQTFLRQVFLVSEIELLKNGEDIKIKTILNHRSSSIFTLFGMLKESKTSESIFKIADVRFSEKDQPNSPIMRIIAGDKRYYMHKNMSKV